MYYNAFISMQYLRGVTTKVMIKTRKKRILVKHAFICQVLHDFIFIFLSMFLKKKNCSLYLVELLVERSQGTICLHGNNFSFFMKRIRQKKKQFVSSMEHNPQYVFSRF